jgi:hypothetical protein
MRYTSNLAKVQHHGAPSSPHVTRDVKLYLIRMWGSISKIRRLDAPGTTIVSPHRHIHLTNPLTVPHMRYTSYLATAPPRRAAGSPHVVREVKL